jgi:hypothetical protein
MCSLNNGRLAKMNFLRCISYAFLLLPALSGSATANPDWQVAFKTLHTCVKQKDEACAVGVAEHVAQEMEPGKPIDYIKELKRFSLPTERLMMLSNLAIYFAAHADTEKAERYFDLAYDERMGRGPEYTGRPTIRARRHLIALHLRNGSSQRLANHLNAITDYAGQPAKLDRKVIELEQATAFIRRARYDFDEAKSAAALGDWIAGVKAGTTEVPVKLVGILAKNGFVTAADTIAKRFPSAAVDEALSQTVSQLTAKRDRFAQLVKLASSNSPKQLFGELERVEAKDGKRRFTTIQSQVRKILSELRKQNKPDIVHSFLSASGRYASTVRQQNCSVMLLTSFLTQSISLGDKGLFAELKARIPFDDGKAEITGNKKCEWLTLTPRQRLPAITQAWMDGETGIASFMDDAPDYGTSKAPIGVNYVLGSAIPYLDQTLVTALYLRHSKLLSGASQLRLSLTLAVVAGHARKTGYDQAAFELLDHALQASRTYRGDPTQSFAVKRTGKVVDFGRLPTPEQMVKLGLGALFTGRHTANNLEAKAKLR